MPFQKQNLAKQFVYLIIFSIAAGLIVQLVFSLDKVKPKVEHYLISNKEVETRLGKIRDISLIRRLSVEGSSEGEKPYMEYKYFVHADKTPAIIVVRVDPPAMGETQEHFSIASLEKKTP